MRDTFKPSSPSDFSQQKKGAFLKSIMSLKEKRDRATKGRNFEYGRKQIEFTSKEESEILTEIL